MGWYFSRTSRKCLIAELTNDSKRDLPDGRSITRTCLAHCYRGNAYRGVLWSVWEVTEYNPLFVQQSHRYIGCDLMEYRDEMWGHKPLEESMGPYSYSCPLGYLRLVPDSEPHTNANWRRGVQAYHAKAVAKRIAKLVR